MTNSYKDTLAQTLRGIFSSMCFGEMFGGWCLMTAVITYHYGWFAASVMVGLYLIVWIAVLTLLWLFRECG